MFAHEEKTAPGGQGAGSRKKPLPWLWPVLVVSDALFLGLVAYFLLAGPRPGLMESLIRLIDARFSWIAVCIGLFIAAALFLSFLRSRRPVEWLTSISREMGWVLERKWGFPGGFGAVTLFGCGPYFRVKHNGLVLAFSPMTDEDSREVGLRVNIFHDRPLGLGLMLKMGAGFSLESRMPHGYRPILSRKLELALSDVHAWAADKERAMDLLSDGEVLKRFEELKRELDLLNEQAESRLMSRSSGIVIGDRRIALLLSKNHHLNRNLLDAVCHLSLALTAARVVPAIAVSRTGDRVYKAVLVTLISLVAASLIWVVTDYIRGV
jgi:hypothetical protein